MVVAMSSMDEHCRKVVLLGDFHTETGVSRRNVLVGDFHRNRGLEKECDDGRLRFFIINIISLLATAP